MKTSYSLSYIAENSFRNQKVLNMFEITSNNIQFDYNIDIPFEKIDWNIGCIIGRSGTGKTTIINKLFNTDDFFVFREYKYDNTKSVIDNIDNNISLEEIIEVLSKIGFNTPKNWVLPYNLLSNGEKMRFDLAKTIIENKNKIIVFDEFTSVVDREVAKNICVCLKKLSIKYKLKMIFVSCHFDILDFLQPDWEYNTNDYSYNEKIPRQRIQNEYEIYEINRENWKMFSKFHYLSNELLNHAKNYGCFVKCNNSFMLVGFCSVKHFFGKSCKIRKQIHRIVILPEYQGIGVGINFLLKICELYNKEHYFISIATSNILFIKSLLKSKHFFVKNISKSHISKKTTKGYYLKKYKNRTIYNLEYAKK